MPNRLASTTAALLLVVAACGTESPTGSGSASSAMSASVDGEQFSPRSADILATRNGNAITFTGQHTIGNKSISITIALANVAAPGTLILNPTFTSQYGRVTISEGSASTTGSWSTLLSPGTGSVTVTSIAAQRVAGTFQFTGQFDPATAATGQMTVSSGTFDIRF